LFNAKIMYNRDGQVKRKEAPMVYDPKTLPRKEARQPRQWLHGSTSRCLLLPPHARYYPISAISHFENSNGGQIEQKASTKYSTTNIGIK